MNPNRKLSIPVATKATKTPELAIVRVTGKNIIVIDTNVLIEDPGCITELRKGGNLLVVPVTVIHELDKLKNDQRVSLEVRKAVREIDRLQEAGDTSLVIEPGMIFSKLNLDENIPDHQIIATLNYVLTRATKNHPPYIGYDKVKMISNDLELKILARGIGNKKEGNVKLREVVVEQYLKSRAKITEKDFVTPIYKISVTNTNADPSQGMSFPALGKLKKVPDGSAIIGYTRPENKKNGEFAAIRHGDNFEVIDFNIEACGIRPRHNGKKNWEQAIALHYALDPKIACLFIQGGTGSGKTLIAVAAALKQRRQGLYSKVLIFRIPEPVERRQELGFTPGTVGQKMALYTEPIEQALIKILKGEKGNYVEDQKEELIRQIPEAISNSKRNRKKRNQPQSQNVNQFNSAKNVSNMQIYVDDIFDQNGFFIKVIQFTRGVTFDEVVIIVDDAQNLTVHQITTIITRVGSGAKIIFTGDLGQIDSPYLNIYSAGLTHAIKKMSGNSMVGVVNIPQTVRSPIAAFAEQVL